MSVGTAGIRVIFYNFQGRRLHQYSVFLDLNEWLMWTTIGVFSLLPALTVFSFDFIFVLPDDDRRGRLYVWIRFIHFPPLIQAYEERLAASATSKRSKTAHPRPRSAPRPPRKPKRRRR